VFIKVYGAIGFCLFLFYPDKLKFIKWSIFWSIQFVILPLIVTPWQTAGIGNTHNWATMMAERPGGILWFIGSGLAAYVVWAW
jgi:hypothetical protein